MLDNELDAMLGKEDNHNHKRKSLGRGLGALLGDDLNFSEDNTSNNVAIDQQIEINKICAGKYQPRTEFDTEALNSLAASIKEKGVLQPLLVRRIGDNKYEIIAGERRWRAAKIAGLSKVPVIEKAFNDQEVLEVALVENLLRENLSAIEEAEGFQRLIDEFSHTQEALSQIIGRSRSHIANILRLLTLPQSVKDLIKEGKITAGHARALVGLDNAEALAKQIEARGLSVRQVEELVAKLKNSQKERSPRKAKDEDLEEIEKDLIKQLGLRIKISPSKQGGGKVVMQYSSVAELDMILNILENKPKNESVSSPNTVFKAEAPAANSEKFTIKMID